MPLLVKLTKHYDRDEAELLINGENYTVTLSDMRSLSLAEELELSDELFGEIVFRDEKLRCMKKALSAVGRTTTSRRQLFLKLRRNFSDDAINASLDNLEKIGYLNDADTAKRYAELYATKKRYGKSRISVELFKKGYNREDISAALEELSVPDDEKQENISALLDKKFRNKAFDKRKAYAYLRGMGYDGSEIKSALDNYCEDDSDEEIMFD